MLGPGLQQSRRKFNSMHSVCIELRVQVHIQHRKWFPRNWASCINLQVKYADAQVRIVQHLSTFTAFQEPITRNNMEIGKCYLGFPANPIDLVVKNFPAHHCSSSILSQLSVNLKVKSFILRTLLNFILCFAHWYTKIIDFLILHAHLVVIS